MFPTHPHNLSICVLGSDSVCVLCLFLRIHLSLNMNLDMYDKMVFGICSVSVRLLSR